MTWEFLSTLKEWLTIDRIAQIMATLVCGIFVGMSCVVVNCRRKRLAAEASLGAIKKEREEWDSRSRELLLEYAKSASYDGLPRLLTSLTSDVQHIESLASFGRLRKMESGMLIDPTEVTTLDLIGKGGFGNVYRGTWRGTPVAVKLMRIEETEDGVVESFVREANLLSRLRHPNIVLYIGVSVLENRNVSIVTELMIRGTLFSVLRAKTIDELGRECYKESLSWQKRLQFAVDVTRGLCYLHGCSPSIVHKDLKSLNLLVASDMTVKLADFGLSALKTKTLLSANSAGTPEWCAPEVLRSEKHGLAADVYSLGVVMWEIIARTAPFNDLNGVQIISHVGIRGGCLPYAKPPEVPVDGERIVPELNNLIAQCTIHNPNKRPTGSAVLSELERLQAILCEEKATELQVAAACNATEIDRAALNSDSELHPSPFSVVRPAPRIPGRVKMGLEPLKLSLSKIGFTP